MESQNNVLGSWSRHTQLSWYGKPFWGTGSQWGQNDI